MRTVQVTPEGTEFKIAFPREDIGVLLDKVKALKFRRYDGEQQCWIVPAQVKNFPDLPRLIAENEFVVSEQAAELLARTQEAKDSAPVSYGVTGKYIDGSLVEFVVDCGGYDYQMNLIIKESGCYAYDKETHLWTVKCQLSGIKAIQRLHSDCGLTLEPGLSEKIESVLKGVQEAIEESALGDADVDLPAPDGLSYLPFQRAGIAYAVKHQNTLLGDDMGLGKQQPIDAKVLTPLGWTEIGRLSVGDSVIGSDGKPTLVKGVYPQGIKPSYRVFFSDGASVEAGPDHLWTVRYKCGGKRWKDLTLTTLQLLERPVITQCREDGYITKLNLAGVRLYLPMLSSPVEFHPVQIDIPPYTMGQILANAYLSGSSAVLTCNDEDYDSISESIAAEQVAMGATRVYGKARRIGLSNLMGPVRAYSVATVSGNKLIPRAYLMASVPDRIALLQGLMDGDGSISKTGNKLVFDSTSKSLAEGVAELVEGLGGIASVRTYDRADEGKPLEYQVRIRCPSWISPFRTPRKADRYKPGSHALPTRVVTKIEYVRDVESVCIAVDAPDRLYATEHCILTHNTIQTIGYSNYFQDIRRVLIICPATLKLNWKREWEKWCVKGLSVGIVNGRNPANWVDTDVVILNYDIAKYHKEKILSVKWDLLACDEAHALKNPKSQRTEAVLGGGRSRKPAIDAERVIMMTGTPILNRPVEIWPLVHRLAPSVFNNFIAFAKRYCGAIQTAYGWDFSGASNLDELQQLLRSTCMVRRMKSDVLKELPPKIRQVIPIEDTAILNKEKRAISSAKELIANLQSEKVLAYLSNDVEAFESAVGKLKECEAKELVAITEARHQTALAKIPYVVDLVRDSLENGKVILFAHHRDVLAAYQEAFKDICVVIHGGVSAEDRQQAIDKFQNDPAYTLAICGITAAGVGVTLTAASHEIFAEIVYTPGVMDQAEDRAYRIGQHKSVVIWYVVIDGTIDANIAASVVKKKVVIKASCDNAKTVDTDVELSDASEQAEEYVLPGFTVVSDAEISDWIKSQKQEPAARVASSNNGRIEQRAKQKGFAREAEAMLPEEIEAVHQNLMTVSGMCDGAVDKDGVGFNGPDARVGNALAGRSSLSPLEAAYARAMLQKYVRQLGKEAIEAMGKN
jgi:superfamily II DNA or RNA helicase